MFGQKLYAEVISLIEEGIEVAEQEVHPGTVYDWRDQLLEVYIQMADHNNILKYAELLFL